MVLILRTFPRVRIADEWGTMKIEKNSPLAFNKTGRIFILIAIPAKAGIQQFAFLFHFQHHDGLGGQCRQEFAVLDLGAL
jgi:hypothetical protein